MSRRVPAQLKIIPTPIRKLEGLWAADRMLRIYGAPGMLVGSLAVHLYKARYVGNLTFKVLDVLVLSTNWKFIPGQWEGGVDWWVSLSENCRPANGTRVGLLWNVRSCLSVQLRAGLYIPSPEVVRRWQSWESLAKIPKSLVKLEIGEGKEEETRSFLPELPFLHPEEIELQQLAWSQPIEKHPKKIQ